MSLTPSNDILQCKNCVCDSIADPDFVLDKDGVCNYCLFAKSKENERRAAKLQLPWIIHNIKKQGKGKEYDCLIGLSGGVDSSMALHYLIEQGLRPLAFSVDNGWQTPEADENIMRLVEGLKVPFIRVPLNLEEFRGLQRAFIQSGMANIEIPTDHVLMAMTYIMARKYKIKTIISGGNWQTEGTMPKAFGYSAGDLTHIKAIAKRFGASINELPTISLLQYLWYRNVKRIKVVNLLDYYDYNRQRAIDLLSRLYGYKSYGEKHGESRFTKWFQRGYLPVKFGIDKRKPHLSSMIHSGQITRNEALKELQAPLGEQNFGEEITIAWRVFEPHNYSDYPTNEKWEARWVKFFNVLKRYGYSR